MFRRRIAATAAFAATAALVLTGCSGGEPATDSEDGARGERLTLISISSPTSFDIGAGAEWGTRSAYFEAVYDTLLRQNAQGEIEPALATEWEYNDDNTVLTLTLRDDATFTDGAPVDAAAVVASLERLRDGTSQVAGTMIGQEYAAVDDTTVTVTLPAPNPALLTQLAIAGGLIASPDSFDDPDVATSPVGSGPYILDTDATVTGTTYVFEANPDYWDQDAIKYDALTINVMQEATAILNAILAGEADGAPIDNNTLAEVEGAGWSYESTELDFQGMMILDRDGEMAPQFADPKVRQAINMAFDREALLEAMQDGHGTVTEQVFQPGWDAFDESLDSTFEYDPEGAKALLAEAGYPDGFAVTMPSIATFQTTLDLVAQQLADIGIDVTYEDPGTGQFLTSILTPKYPMTWMSLAQSPDWNTATILLAPNAVFNPFKTQRDEVDAYIDQMQNGTEDEAAGAAHGLNQYIVDEGWFAPFFRVQGSFGVSEDTTFEYWPTNMFPSLFSFEPKN
ncbi:peptide/nickel transport system substrate-binding protein [Microbacterium terrae]|uniref:Glutathione-binding protein GsiB n=1 Tax=Microbacterium terrae TaxID=69369 RepID=A0A0M2GUY3_9MICO|nr:ABC transporter substrate-binding protein [Microbacterium terrae]KJL37496.1 Glutathione-binding protein GsiB precursor [Microbacterium terrae]MBP1076325.1 peptide/nickel transport system substrate-binding protein [Microbacterium terrae]GLJ97149.1 peptide ABC transporter substrate-binding protein [Microbacterium terrae]